MIQSKSDRPPYVARFTNGTHEGLADTTPDKGGGGKGFRPHDLLEAALASCMNMTVRMYADEHGIALDFVTTKVKLNRETEGVARFEYQIELTGEMGAVERKRLLDVAARCPVRKTLSRLVEFNDLDDK